MKRIVLVAIIVLCCVLLFGGRERSAGSAPEGMIEGVRTPGAAANAASAWTAIGPYGGEVGGLARNPKYPSELYASAAAYPSQFFKSTNNGLTWTRTYICNNSIQDIVTDPTNSNVVFAYSNYAILKSSDRGVTFPDSIACPSGFQAYGGRMAIHPSNPKILYITGSQVVNTSTWAYCPAVANTQ